MNEHGCFLWELLQLTEMLGTRNGCLISVGLVATLIAAYVLVTRGVPMPWLITGFMIVNVIWVLGVLHTGGNLEL